MIKKVSLQKADILKTHGNNIKVLKITNFKKFEKFEAALNNTINWYQENYSK